MQHPKVLQLIFHHTDFSSPMKGIYLFLSLRMFILGKIMDIGSIYQKHSYIYVATGVLVVTRFIIQFQE